MKNPAAIGTRTPAPATPGAPPAASPSDAAGPGEPASTLAVRPDASTDPAVIRLVHGAAVKVNAFASRPGYPRSMSKLLTELHVEAWVRNDAYEKQVWVEAHVIDDLGVVVREETHPLRYDRTDADGGDVWLLDAPLYEGATATPGSVEPRPDARRVEYRLYRRIDGRVHTDGLVHRCLLRPDTASR